VIELYYWTTPNGHKVTMFLEETGTPYEVVPVDIGSGQQFDRSFLEIAPNNRVPAIRDLSPAGGGEPISIFESGAILQYLAEKTGRLLPTDIRGRTETMQWLFWQMAGLGPIAGQNHHFRHYAAEKIPYAIDRFVGETGRLYSVLNRRLGGRAFIAGDEYSIADLACFPWVHMHDAQGQDLTEFTNLGAGTKRYALGLQRSGPTRLPNGSTQVRGVSERTSSVVISLARTPPPSRLPWGVKNLGKHIRQPDCSPEPPESKSSRVRTQINQIQ